MIFVDTGAWAALTNERDGFHKAALAVFHRIATGTFGKMVTTDYVLDETYTLLRMKEGFEAVDSLATRLDSTPHVRLVWIDEGQFRRALALMRERRDKRWSLTDCTSFIAMEDLGIRDAFAFDPNFTEAGFSAEGIPK